MTRVSLCCLLSLLVPAIAGAQAVPVPPTPPAAPLPAAAPAPAPLPAPAAPAVMVAPVIASMAPMAAMAPVMAIDLDDAIAAARAAVANMDTAAVRQSADAAVQQARAALDHGQAAGQVFGAQQLASINNFDFAFDMQDFVTMRGTSNDNQYNQGQMLLQRHEYDQAVVQFDRVVAAGGSHADGALYYKAWALSKLGKSDEAAAALAQLRKDYPSSRYLNDARALEADVKKLGPGQVDDDDLKLLAIQGMHSADPARAVPLLEGVLNATNSLAVKKNALYVLGTIDSPQAHEVLLGYAKGKGNPDLQRTAILYLGARGSKTSSAELIDIYNSNPDFEVRLSIIGAFRGAGDKASLVRIASGQGFGGPATPAEMNGGRGGRGDGVGVGVGVGRGMTAPVALQSRAISSLTDLASPQELWPLYQKEENKDLRLEWVSTFASMNATEQLLQIVKDEKDPSVRQRAIRSLGNLKSDKTGQTLVDLYSSNTDKVTRQAVITALANQNNADALVAIARKETDRDLKVEIVRQLVNMQPRSKAASDYLMEIIK